MKNSGRLVETGSETQGVWNTNILPTLMSREELFAGLKWLGNHLYDPYNFAQRVIRMIQVLGPQRGPFKAGYTPHKGRPVEAEASGVIRKLLRRGPAERQMWKTISDALAEKPEAGPMVMNSLFSYAQVRCLYETDHYWEPEVVGAPMLPDPLLAPALTAPPAAVIHSAL
jgi:Domain of unknown function (DUF4070)